MCETKRNDDLLKMKTGPGAQLFGAQNFFRYSNILLRLSQRGQLRVNINGNLKQQLQHLNAKYAHKFCKQQAMDQPMYGRAFYEVGWS